MQEEIEQKSFNIMISTTKLSARTVLRAVKAAFRMYQSKAFQGKQSVRTLLRQNRGVSSVEISKTGIRGLERYVKRALCCADNKATKLLRELEKFGLIERKRRGQGKPSLVYVKNFSAESLKESVKNRDNDDSCGFKIACQDPAKSRCNKTKENDTEMSETDPFYSEEADGMSKRTQLEEYFSQSLEVELLLRLCPDDEDNQIRQNSSLQAISPQFSCGSARIKNKGLNFNCQNGGTIMAIFEKTIRNKNFDKLLRKLEQEIPDSSWSADLEAGSDFKEGDARCSVRVFERYSMMGGNRLSLTLTMFQNADSPIRLSAITAGGSQAVFFKVNTLGEESFLDDVKDLLEEILEE